MAKTSADKTTKSLVTGCKSPSQKTIVAMAVEVLVSPLSGTADETTSIQTAELEKWAKKTESAENWWPHKATEANA